MRTETQFPNTILYLNNKLQPAQLRSTKFSPHARIMGSMKTEYDKYVRINGNSEITLEITIVYSFGRSDNTIILKHQLHGLLVPTGLEIV